MKLRRRPVPEMPAAPVTLVGCRWCGRGLPDPGWLNAVEEAPHDPEKPQWGECPTCADPDRRAAFLALLVRRHVPIPDVRFVAGAAFGADRVVTWSVIHCRNYGHHQARPWGHIDARTARMIAAEAHRLAARSAAAAARAAELHKTATCSACGWTGRALKDDGSFNDVHWAYIAPDAPVPPARPGTKPRRTLCLLCTPVVRPAPPPPPAKKAKPKPKPVVKLDPVPAPLAHLPGPKHVPGAPPPSTTSWQAYAARRDAMKDKPLRVEAEVHRDPVTGRMWARVPKSALSGLGWGESRR